MTGRQRLHAMEQRLDNTFKRVDTLPQTDLELRADFARYLCVLVSGYLETAIAQLLTDYAIRNAHRQVADFVGRSLDRLTNTNRQRILDTLAKFSGDWHDQGASFITEEREAAVNSVVANRHQIAHGNSVGVTISQIRYHYKAIKSVVEWLANLTGPPTSAAA